MLLMPSIVAQSSIAMLFAVSTSRPEDLLVKMAGALRKEVYK